MQCNPYTSRSRNYSNTNQEPEGDGAEDESPAQARTPCVAASHRGFPIPHAWKSLLEQHRHGWQWAAVSSLAGVLLPLSNPGATDLVKKIWKKIEAQTLEIVVVTGGKGEKGGGD